MEFVVHVVQYIKDETSRLSMDEKVKLIQDGKLVNDILLEWEDEKMFENQ